MTTTLKGRKNIYACQRCGGQFVTVDRDEGTTPFMTRCRATDNCEGHAQSSFYRVDQGLAPTHEWYRLTDKAARTQSPASRKHHEMGGLFLRRIEQ